MENLEFEIEVMSVPEALERINEIRESFGDVYILVKFANSNKNAILKQLDNVCAAMASKLEGAK